MLLNSSKWYDSVVQASLEVIERQFIIPAGGIIIDPDLDSTCLLYQFRNVDSAKSVSRKIALVREGFMRCGSYIEIPRKTLEELNDRGPNDGELCCA